LIEILPQGYGILIKIRVGKPTEILEILQDDLVPIRHRMHKKYFLVGKQIRIHIDRQTIRIH
jgi:hypothetical protein